MGVMTKKGMGVFQDFYAQLEQVFHENLTEDHAIIKFTRNLNNGQVEVKDIYSVGKINNERERRKTAKKAVLTLQIADIELRKAGLKDNKV